MKAKGGTHMAIEASEIGAGLDPATLDRPTAKVSAGVGSAQQLMFFLIAALSALAVGSAVLVAQAVGAGDTQRASRLARHSLLWSGMLSIPLAIGGLLLSDSVIG